MIAQTSAVNTDDESGNFMEITVFDGKTVAQATAFPSRETICINRNVITVPISYFHEKLLVY